MDSTLKGQMELQEKVARLCGFTSFEIYSTVLCGWTTLDRGTNFLWLAADGFRLYRVPDYCNDLNACHKFEKLLTTEEQQRNYVAALVGLRWDEAWSFTDAAKAVHAAAEQRCWAFIAVMERDDAESASNQKEQETPRQQPKSASAAKGLPNADASFKNECSLASRNTTDEGED